MLVRYCTAVALKRHERVNAFNLVCLDTEFSCPIIPEFTGFIPAQRSCHNK